MAALEPHYMAILEKVHVERFVPLRANRGFRSKSLDYPRKQVRHHG